jgi:DNA-binding response OmpR family regulator
MQILVVEGSLTSRRFIREELSGGGYEVLEVANGADALQRFQEHRPALVTLNVDMPGRDGFELCESLRALETIANNGRQVESIVPVLFVTARDSLADRERGYAAGATDFIVKPFAPGHLLRAVDEILRPKPLWANLVALVADDSALTRHIVAEALLRLGVCVIEAQNGREALERALAHAERLALIVSDLRMPLLDGRGLCERVRRTDALKDVPFIVLSVASDRDAVLGLFQAGATDYLIKPFSLEELLARVRVHLDARLLRRDLELRNEEMREQLRLASAVQRSALHLRASAEHVQRAVCYQPQGQVSGDVYDFSLAASGALNTFLGDATGHGLGAAFMTIMVQTALDSIGPDASLDETLTRLHALIHERSGDRFVTGVYARLAPDGRLEHASAGHPPIVWVPRQGEARLLEAQGGLPLGLLREPLPFPPGSAQLAPGDRVYLYSDGLVEWSRRDGAQFTLERALAWLSERRGEPIEACVNGVVEAAADFAAGAPCDDDVTLIGLEYAPR